MLDSKMVIDQINLYKLISMNVPTTTGLTQEEYDRIQIPDHNTIYIIINSPDRRIYYGKNLVKFKDTDRMYLVGSGKEYGEYIIWLNEKIGYDDHLIEINTFKDPQSAIDTMNKYNKIGSHSDLALSTYNILLSYLIKDIKLHDFIIGVIALFGYRDDRRLQDIINTTMIMGAHLLDNDLPILLKDELATLKLSQNHLYRYYSDIYDLVVLYNFFKEGKYRKSPYDVDLSDVIKMIFKIIAGTN